MSAHATQRGQTALPERHACAVSQSTTRCKGITDQPILVRLDGGNDAIDNIDVLLEHRQGQPQEEAAVDFIIKWNPRRVDKEAWLKTAEQQGCWDTPRECKRSAIFSETVTRSWRGYDYEVRRVIRLTERTINKHGQALLIPEIELEGWWTSLDIKENDVIKLYADHGTSEQFHSEFKTDLDIEQLPSGKFATNALVLAMSVLAYGGNSGDTRGNSGEGNSGDTILNYRYHELPLWVDSSQTSQNH